MYGTWRTTRSVYHWLNVEIYAVGLRSVGEVIVEGKDRISIVSSHCGTKKTVRVRSLTGKVVTLTFPFPLR